MAGKDPELQRLSSEMDQAQRAIDSAKARLDPIRDKRSSIKSQMDSISYNIADLKRTIGNEYEAMRVCKAARDRIGADNHRYNAESYRSSLSSQYDIKNGLRSQLDYLRSDYDSAMSALNDAKARKQQLRESFNRRLEYLKAESEREKASWRETTCKRCGTTIRYRIDWSRIPDLCKPCREYEKAQWAETTCKSCGKAIRYKRDWSHIPNLCKECKERDAANWREAICRVCGKPFRYRIDWAHIPTVCKPCKEESRR